MPPAPQISAKALELTAYRLFINKYYALGATVMLLYDTIITMDREVQFMWHSQWSGVKALFFFNRYANIVVYILSWISVNADWPADLCHRIQLFPGIFNLVQQLVIGAVLMLYVSALCNRSRPIILAVLVVFITQIVIIGWSLGAITTVTLPPPFVGCIRSSKKGSSLRVITSWIMQLVFITVGFGIMFWHATRLRRHQVITPMISFMTRDGLKYFAVIFVANFVNVMNFSLVKPKDLRSLHATFSALLTVVMINRLILSIREEATGAAGQYSRSTVTETTGTGSIAFFHHVTVVQEHDISEVQQQAARRRDNSVAMQHI